jgi:hypothetical protein
MRLMMLPPSVVMMRRVGGWVPQEAVVVALSLHGWMVLWIEDYVMAHSSPLLG